MVAPTISRIIQQFKGYVTKQIGESIWQKLYYDHIIRDDVDYQQIWQYIDIFNRIGYTIIRSILVITVSNWCCQFTDSITSIFYFNKISVLKFFSYIVLELVSRKGCAFACTLAVPKELLTWCVAIL